jgi:hypothetical protein
LVSIGLACVSMAPIVLYTAGFLKPVICQVLTTPSVCMPRHDYCLWLACNVACCPQVACCLTAGFVNDSMTAYQEGDIHAMTDCRLVVKPELLNMLQPRIVGAGRLTTASWQHQPSQLLTSPLPKKSSPPPPASPTWDGRANRQGTDWHNPLVWEQKHSKPPGTNCEVAGHCKQWGSMCQQCLPAWLDCTLPWACANPAALQKVPTQQHATLGSATH